MTAATSRDAVELGYRAVVIDDACRGVNESDITAAKQQLVELGAVILNSDEVRADVWILDVWILVRCLGVRHFLNAGTQYIGVFVMGVIIIMVAIIIM